MKAVAVASAVFEILPERPASIHYESENPVACCVGAHHEQARAVRNISQRQQRRLAKVRRQRHGDDQVVVHFFLRDERAEKLIDWRQPCGSSFSN